MPSPKPASATRPPPTPPAHQSSASRRAAPSPRARTPRRASANPAPSVPSPGSSATPGAIRHLINSNPVPLSVASATAAWRAAVPDADAPASASASLAMPLQTHLSATPEFTPAMLASASRVFASTARADPLRAARSSTPSPLSTHHPLAAHHLSLLSRSAGHNGHASSIAPDYFDVAASLWPLHAPARPLDPPMQSDVDIEEYHEGDDDDGDDDAHAPDGEHEEPMSSLDTNGEADEHPRDDDARHAHPDRGQLLSDDDAPFDTGEHAHHLSATPARATPRASSHRAGTRSHAFDTRREGSVRKAATPLATSCHGSASRTSVQTLLAGIRSPHVARPLPAEAATPCGSEDASDPRDDAVDEAEPDSREHAADLEDSAQDTVDEPVAEAEAREDAGDQAEAGEEEASPEGPDQHKEDQDEAAGNDAAEKEAGEEKADLEGTHLIEQFIGSENENMDTEKEAEAENPADKEDDVDKIESGQAVEEDQVEDSVDPVIAENQEQPDDNEDEQDDDAAAEPQNDAQKNPHPDPQPNPSGAVVTDDDALEAPTPVPPPDLDDDLALMSDADPDRVASQGLSVNPDQNAEPKSTPAPAVQVSNPRVTRTSERTATKSASKKRASAVDDGHDTAIAKGTPARSPAPASTPSHAVRPRKSTDKRKPPEPRRRAVSSARKSDASEIVLPSVVKLKTPSSSKTRAKRSPSPAVPMPGSVDPDTEDTPIAASSSKACASEIVVPSVVKLKTPSSSKTRAKRAPSPVIPKPGVVDPDTEDVPIAASSSKARASETVVPSVVKLKTPSSSKTRAKRAPSPVVPKPGVVDPDTEDVPIAASSSKARARMSPPLASAAKPGRAEPDADADPVVQKRDTPARTTRSASKESKLPSPVTSRGRFSCDKDDIELLPRKRDLEGPGTDQSSRGTRAARTSAARDADAPEPEMVENVKPASPTNGQARKRKQAVAAAPAVSRRPPKRRASAPASMANAAKAATGSTSAHAATNAAALGIAPALNDGGELDEDTPAANVTARRRLADFTPKRLTFSDTRKSLPSLPAVVVPRGSKPPTGKRAGASRFTTELATRRRTTASSATTATVAPPARDESLESGDLADVDADTTPDEDATNHGTQRWRRSPRREQRVASSARHAPSPRPAKRAAKDRPARNDDAEGSAGTTVHREMDENGDDAVAATGTAETRAKKRRRGRALSDGGASTRSAAVAASKAGGKRSERQKRASAPPEVRPKPKRRRVSEVLRLQKSLASAAWTDSIAVERQTEELPVVEYGGARASPLVARVSRPGAESPGVARKKAGARAR